MRAFRRWLTRAGRTYETCSQSALVDTAVLLAGPNVLAADEAHPSSACRWPPDKREYRDGVRRDRPRAYAPSGERPSPRGDQGGDRAGCAGFGAVGRAAL